uniref:Inositol hexakisphosphate and diphosphoinositol-pentakisphosphate kinase n=1 Tax=Panagrolaimus davidi TaxID=227884 RepID=A0A914P998_9BILA
MFLIYRYGHFSGINRKVQLKYLKPKTESDDEMRKKPALMLIIKWGGELTTAGVLQAEALGKLFRTLYPGIRRTDGKACPEDTQGLGFLRLHSTYRHDLKIYSSDEGRVQMTAAAFARGLLALEGELTPILMQMVKSSNTDPLLNDDFNARQFQTDLKGYLHSALQVDRDFTTEDYAALNPSSLRSINNAMDFIKNPRKMCHEIAAHVQKMVEIIRWHKMNAATSEKQLYLNESWELAESRWSKELREFRRTKKDEEGNTMIDFDISKIPDIYDNIKYDLEHNPELGINNECEFERMYVCVKNMADIVVPQEYGISEESKISIAQRVCTPLLAKLRNDLHRCVQDPEESDETTRLDPRASEGIATPMRHVRTRLYFTSESHIHTLMNLIRYGGLCTPDDQKWQRAMKFLSSVTEFNYMTQVVLMVYEDSRSEAGKEGTDRFHIELLFSPGLYPCFQTEKERIYETRFNTSKNQKASSKKQPKHSSSSGRNSDTSDKETTSEEPSRKESMTGAAKAALESFISHRSKSTDSSMVASAAAAKTKVSLSPRIQNTPPNWLQAPSNANPSNANSGGITTLTKIESGNTLTIEEDKLDTVSTGGDRHVTTVDGRAITESDDELADHSVNLVVLGEVGGGKEYDTLNPSKLVAKKLLEGDSKDSKKIQFILNKNPLPGGVLKSMSDISCNRRPRSASVEESEERSEERPQSRQSAKKLQHQLLTPDELDDNQATVGSGRGKWAKELVAETYGAMGKSPPPEIQEPKEDRRPYASEVFSRGDVIVMKRSESNEYHSLAALAPSVASTATISSGSRDDEQAASSSRRSRFPYKFKHHTVNLLTG